MLFLADSDCLLCHHLLPISGELALGLHFCRHCFSFRDWWILSLPASLSFSQLLGCHEQPILISIPHLANSSRSYWAYFSFLSSCSLSLSFGLSLNDLNPVTFFFWLRNYWSLHQVIWIKILIDWISQGLSSLFAFIRFNFDLLHLRELEAMSIFQMVNVSPQEVLLPIPPFCS